MNSLRSGSILGPDILAVLADGLTTHPIDLLLSLAEIPLPRGRAVVQAGANGSKNTHEGITSFSNQVIIGPGIWDVNGCEYL
jgi:hypothetical protein